MESKEATSSASAEERDPYRLFGEGKRHLACNEPQSAVECLQEACRRLAEKHGEMADELGEVYMAYGRALFDLSRQESEVFGEKVTAAAAENDDDSDDDDEGTPYGAVLAASHHAAVTALVADTSLPNKAGDTGEGSSSSHNKGEQLEAAAGSSIGDADKSAADSSDDEDLTNLQLAWEVLETARVIFSKQDSRESRYNLAEVYQLLGELNMEKDSFEDADSDLQKALGILQELEPQGSRLIAETQYTIGLLNALSAQYSVAIKAYSIAVEQLKLRLEIVQRKKEEASSLPEGERKTAVQRADREIADINDILPDLHSKIEDQTIALQHPALPDVAHSALPGRPSSSDSTTTDTGSGLVSSSSLQSSSKVTGPVNDISHLVRKRKADSDAPPAKRIQPIALTSVTTGTALASATTGFALASATAGVDVSGFAQIKEEADNKHKDSIPSSTT